MSFVVTLERSTDLDRHDAFSRFIDFPAWRRWMPKSFRPLKGPERPLRSGDRILLSIDFGFGFGMPSPAKVTRVEADRSITWRGGVNGLLVGEHSFFFEDQDGGGTRIRSSERFTGVVVMPSRGEERVRLLAERIGREQVEGFLASSG